MKITTTLFGDLAILPNVAKVNSSENIEYLTEIMEAKDGTRQCQQLRSLPRQTFTYLYGFTKYQMAAAFNTQYGGITQKWAVPLWAEGQNVGNVLANAPSITCDTTIHDLRPNSLALLRTSDDVWQIVEISTITDTSINVSNTLIYQPQARLYPVRIGWIPDQIPRGVSGVFVNCSIKFNIDDLRDVPAVVLAQYLGNDIYYDVSLLGGVSLSRVLKSRVDTNDQDIGIVAHRTPWANGRYGTPFNALFSNIQEIFKFRGFLSRCRGKFNTFWMPTFEANLRVISSGIITTTLLIKADGYADYTARTHIAIQTDDGVWHPFTVSNPTVVAGGNIQLTLDHAFNIDASQIVKVSYLGLYQMDSDSFDLTFIGQGKAKTTFNMIELTP